MLNKFQNYLQRYAIGKTRTTLLSLSDRQLSDVGISRKSLEGGVKNWPWRDEAVSAAALPTDMVDQPVQMKSKDINKAVRELSSMSDAQLRDIGIDRGSIRHAAMHGVAERQPRSAA